MGKNPWISILKRRCRDVYTKCKNKAKCCAPPLVELSGVIIDERVQEAIEEEGPFPDLPHDIMIDILIRLPAKCIFPLLQQNNSIGLTTATPYFKRTHLDRATPTIVVQSRKYEQFVDSYSDIKLFLFDDKAEKVEAAILNLSLFHAYCKGPIDLWGSYDGFLLFKNGWGLTSLLCISNPITNEQVILTSPDDLSFVCGIYFHPRKKEYEVVYVRGLSGKRIMWEFEILSLRTNQRRSVGRLSYPPSKERSPVFMNGTLYWMVTGFTCFIHKHFYPEISESILSFNIETEELSTMEVVMPSNYAPQLRKYPDDEFQLFELEGDLILFDPSSRIQVLIWVYNYNTKRWDIKHSIPSPDYKHQWDFRKYFSHIEYIKTKGEFIAYHKWDERYPSYIYNLHLGTWKLLQRKGFENDYFTAAICTHSLVSLDAADSVISIVDTKCVTLTSYLKECRR